MGADHRHRERHRMPARRASKEDLMVGINQLDKHLVLAGLARRDMRRGGFMLTAGMHGGLP